MARNNYYNRRYPSYNLGGLTSGISFDTGQSPIYEGTEKLFQDLQSIEAQKYVDEEVRQTKFKELIDISLKDVRGAWRDEAVAKKQTFLDKATTLASESQGKLTWEQEKQLMQEKEGLERFAGMSKEVEDWYGKAVQTAQNIKDQEAQKATMDNITNIMATKGLAETYDLTQDPNWLVQKEYRLDDALGKVVAIWGRDGRPDIDKMIKQTEGDVASGTPETMAEKERYMQNVPGATDKGFPKYMAEMKAFEMGSKENLAQKESLAREEANRSAEENAIVTLKADEKGYVDFRGITKKGEGIPIQTVTDEKGNTYYGATIEGRKYDKDGKKVYVVTHNVPKQSAIDYMERKQKFFLRKAKEQNEKEKLGLSGAEINKLAAKNYSDWEAVGLVKYISDNKSNFEAKKVNVPAERLKNAVELAKREYNIDVEPWGEAPEQEKPEAKKKKSIWPNWVTGKGMLQENKFNATDAQSKYGYGK